MVAVLGSGRRPTPEELVEIRARNIFERDFSVHHRPVCNQCGEEITELSWLRYFPYGGGQEWRHYKLKGDHMAAYRELLPKGREALLKYYQANIHLAHEKTDRVPL